MAIALPLHLESMLTGMNPRYMALILSPSTHSITEARCVTPFLPGPILHPNLGNNELARASYKLPVGGIDNVMSLGHVAAKPQEVSLATKTADCGHGDTDATKPAGPATEGTEPSQLQYYDPSTFNIIDHAKQFSHCDAASINAFPPSTILRKQSLSIEHDTSTFQRLWEDLGNWHSGLRKKAQTFVAQHYLWDPRNCHEQNIEIARCLLGNGSLFLKDGIDDEGHANNLTHPVLAGLIINSFYTSSTSLGQLFPEVFSPEVPRLKVVLDEIVSGQNMNPAHPMGPTWKMQFDTLDISKDLNTDASLEWLQAMAIPNAMISGVLSIIHPLLYKAGIQGIVKLKMETALNNSIMERALAVWPTAFTNISLISNRACPLHHGPHLSGNWYNITANVGDHSSCIMSIPTLGVELVYDPGMVVAFSGCLL
ncbi:hypothetical protein EDC04DRAFT_2607891 [Pisolithus marmoratus]|nr:hypothetical protein EDC04DRAFT_2607891 [Pisolithus marmoratus]